MVRCHGEKWAPFFFVSSSKDNYTESIQWTADGQHIPPHARAALTLFQRAFLYVPRGAKIPNRLRCLWVQTQGTRGWHLVWVVGCWGVTYCTWRNTRPFVKHSHYRQSASECDLGGGGQEHKIDPPPVWVQQSVRRCVCLTNCVGPLWWRLCLPSLWGGVPGSCNCPVEDAGRLTSCSSGGGGVRKVSRSR